MYSRRQQICNFQLLLITINNCALIHNLSSSIPHSLHDKMQTDQNVSNKNAKSLNIPFLPTRRNHTNMFLITGPPPFRRCSVVKISHLQQANADTCYDSTRQPSAKANGAATEQ